MPARGEKGVVNLVDPTGRIIVNPQRSPGAGSPRSLSFNEIKFNEVAILCGDAVACVKRKLDKISAALRMRLEAVSPSRCRHYNHEAHTHQPTKLGQYMAVLLITQQTFQTLFGAIL